MANVGHVWYFTNPIKMYDICQSNSKIVENDISLESNKLREPVVVYD